MRSIRVFEGVAAELVEGGMQLSPGGMPLSPLKQAPAPISGRQP